MPLAAAQTPTLLIDLVVVLGAAAVVTLGLRRMRLATIPGYLIAGALVGPFALDLVRDQQNIAAISQIAIILLMFGIGLHMDLDVLRGGMFRSLWVGVVSTLGTVLLATPLAMVMGVSAPPAVAIAAALAMSSTAAVLRLLQQRRELEQTPGRIALGVLIAQDLLVVVVLGLIPVLSVWAGMSESADTSRSVLRMAQRVTLTVGGIGMLVLVGRWVLPKVMEVASRGASAELLLVFGGAAALGSAAATSALGMSAELGAFLAGFLLASTDFRSEIQGQLAPLRDLFMAVFFVAVGLGADLGQLAPIWWVVVLAAVLTAVVKAVSIGVSAWAFGAPPPSAVRVGVTLAQAGEFTLVVVHEATGAGLFGAREQSVVVGVVVLTLMFTPLMVGQSRVLAHRATRLPPPPWIGRMHRRHEVEAGEPGGAIVAGFGPVGRAVAQRLDLSGVPFVVVDLNAETVKRQRELGHRAIYGDITNPEVLDAAGVRHASGVVITIPDDEAMLRACRAVRLAAPEAFIAARANVLSSAILARGMGVDHVTVEEIATAESMAHEIIARLAPPEEG